MRRVRVRARATTMNFPLPAGSGRKEVLGAVENALVPAAEKFKPELLLISAGFDSRIGDLLGQFTLTDQDFADLTRVVMEIADRHAGGPRGLDAGGRLQPRRSRIGGRLPCRGAYRENS